MREKTARPKDIDRYINFLKDIKRNDIEHNVVSPLNFKDHVKAHGVSKSIEFALKKLGAIKMESEFSWSYEWGEPTKNHALQILDFLLSWRKQKEQQPTLNFGAEFQTIIERLRSISQDLKELLKPADLMISESDAKQELRNKIAGQIASGAFQLIIETGNYSAMPETNDFIIAATDDLITKLYKK